jgi:hypothetical protein
MNLTSRLVFCLLIISFAIGNIYKFSFFSPDVRISFLDITVFISTILVLIQNFNNLNHIYHSNKLILKPLFWFSLFAFTSLLLSYFHYGFTALAVGGLYLARFIFLSVFYLGLRQVFTQKQLHRLFLALSLVLLITGLSQYLISPDVRSLAVSEWDPHYYRVVGTLLDPGFTGELLLLVMIYLLTGQFSNRRLTIFWVILTYIAFSLTYSRSSFLGAFAALFLYSYLKKSWKTLFLGAALLTATLLILPRAPGGEGVKLERTSSIEARIINWKNSLTIFFQHPLIGVGFNTYRYAQKQSGFLDTGIWLKSHAGAGADSSLLFVAATTGAVGLVLYLFYLKSLWQVSRSYLPFRLGLVTLFVHSLFLNSLFYPFILVWLAILTAVATKDYK